MGLLASKHRALAVRAELLSFGRACIPGHQFFAHRLFVVVCVCVLLLAQSVTARRLFLPASQSAFCGGDPKRLVGYCAVPLVSSAQALLCNTTS